MALSTVEQAQQNLAEWRHDPVKMCWDEFNFTPDKWQAKALREFGDQSEVRKRISLQACAGPGKTAVEALCALNFMACYASPGRHPSGIALSESWPNLQDNLWKEIAMWQGRSRFFSSAFEHTVRRFFAREHPKTWFISARSWSKKADQEALGRTLSGLHGSFIGYFLDETGDIPPAVLRSAEQGLSGCEFGRIMQAGNPTSHDGMLYFAAANEPHKWTIISITGDPEDPDRSPRVDIEWAAQQIEEYGRDNPWVMAMILGKFPDTAVNALVGIEDVEAAMKRHLTRDQYQFVQKRIGCDPARFGDDSTVLCPRQGLWVGKLKAMRGANSTEVATAILSGKAKFGSEMELIDAGGGYASGIVDACSLAGVELYEVNFGGKADDPRYFNKRSEIAFLAKKAIEGGGALPPDPQLKRELLAFRYWYEKGKFRINEKDQIKKKLNGHSPDRADALFTTYGVVDMPAQNAPEMIGQGAGAPKAKSEWDPLDQDHT